MSKEIKVTWVCPKCGETWYWYKDCGMLYPACAKCGTRMVIEAGTGRKP